MVCKWLMVIDGCEWLLMVCKSPYKYKSLVLISNCFSARNWTLPWETFLHSLWSRARGWSKQKVKIIYFQIICFSIDYAYQILYSLIFGHYLRLSSWCKWKQALIYPYSTIFYHSYPKVEWYQLFTINTVNHLLKSFYFHCHVLWECLH